MYIRVPQAPGLGELPATFPAFRELAGPQVATTPLVNMAPALLCASNLAYVKPTQTTPPFFTDKANAHYSTRAGLLDLPEIVEGGVQLIDRCLIGTIRDPAGRPNQKAVVLAFRGTIPLQLKDSILMIKSIFDWLNDLQAVLVPVAEIPGLPGARAALSNVKVHAGFQGSVVSLFRSGIAAKLLARVRQNGDAPLYITGHSKGGALVHLAALLLQAAGIKVAGAISFEAPRIGNSSFAAAYQASGIDSLRYEFQDDIAPHVPPTAAFPGLVDFMAKLPLPLSAPWSKVKQGAFNYEHVGALRFVDWNGVVRTGDSTALQEARFIALKSALTSMTKLRNLGSMHAINCGATPSETSGLWKAVCGTTNY